MADFGVRNRRVLVVGAGIIGLDTALKIQEDMPDVSVTIRAEKFHPDTTSNVAPGIFRPPGTSGLRAPNETLKEFWLSESWNRLNRLRMEEGPKATGIVEVPLFVVSSGDSQSDYEATQVPFVAKNSYVHRKCTQQELDLFQPSGHWKSGTYCHTLVVDTSRYLPWAMNRFKARGGKVQKGRVESWQDVAKEGWDLIVNCTGPGAKELCKDTCMTANRGQVMKVWAPWVKVALFADSDVIIVPGVDLVTVGRTIQLHNNKKTVDQHDSKGIWDRVTRIMPNLEKAKIIKETVGIRPTRTQVRIEKELLSDGTKIVHNYGHCGYGIMSAWGSAVTASKLAKEAMQGDMRNHHL